MGKIIITAKYEVETEHNLDEATVKSIANAMTDSMNDNMDAETVVEVTEMTATFQTTVSVLDKPMPTEDTGHVDQ